MWRPEIFHEEVDGKAQSGSFNMYSIKGTAIGQNEKMVQLNPGEQVILENGSQYLAVKDQSMPRNKYDSQTGFVNLLVATSLQAAIAEATKTRNSINLKTTNNQTVSLGDAEIVFTWSPSPKES